MMDYFRTHNDAWTYYNKTVRDKGFTHGVPKERLLVKMGAGATQYDTDIVAAGIM